MAFKNSVHSNSDLANRLQNAFVFNISLENGTTYDPEVDYDPTNAIGTRMLYQLMPNNRWDTFSRQHSITPVKF